MHFNEISFSPLLRGRIVLPASKSLSARALIINALCGNDASPANLSDCDDTQVLLRALTERKAVTDIHAAGTAMRFSTAYFAAAAGEEHVITGTPRMCQRPIAVLTDALRSLGADIEYAGNEGFPPLRVRGRQLDGGTVELPADVSSQYISALLMLGPVLRRGLEIRLTGEIVSRPYIDMTLGLMRHFGASAGWTGEQTLSVAPQPYRKGTGYEVEADWSAASYWYEMVALSPDAGARIELPGLQENSLQGDAEVRHFFEQLGVSTEFTGDGAVLTKRERCGTEPQACRLDLTRQPDLAQTLTVTCAMTGRPFHLTGLQSLRIKETDRIAALRRELAKLGCDIGEANGSELFSAATAPPPRPASTVETDTYDDHRMAMSFAPCALLTGRLRINCPEVVSKSYPGFWDDLRRIGADISENRGASATY